jgi:transmembrane sensor
VLKAPIAERLRSRVNEAAVARMWRGIRERRRANRFSRFLRPSLLGAAFGLLSASLVIAVHLRLQPPRNPTSEASLPLHPLSMRDGSRIEPAEVPTNGVPTNFRLSDGSELLFGTATRWEPLAISGTQMVSTLRYGRVLFEVQPGGPRRWVVECGPVSVEVVGTRFSVYRDAARVSVSVERGIVIVRGERVPDAVQSLTAGQSIDVDVGPGQAPSATAATSAARSNGAPRGSSPASGWILDAEKGKFRDAYRTLGAAGIASSSAGATDAERLLMLADVARLSGHPADAVAPLERLVAEHAESAQAGLAAVTLGRLLLDQLSQPAQAARMLERALSMRIPSSLREDVYARLVEADLRAGNPAAAKIARSRYETEFKDGRLRGLIERATQSQQ